MPLTAGGRGECGPGASPCAGGRLFTAAIRIFACYLAGIGKKEGVRMNDNKDSFDLWCEWAEKPLNSMLMIDSAIHDAVMALPPDERRDRAKVNEAVRRERGLPCWTIRTWPGAN